MGREDDTENTQVKFGNPMDFISLQMLCNNDFKYKKTLLYIMRNVFTNSLSDKKHLTAAAFNSNPFFSNSRQYLGTTDFTEIN